MSHCIIWLRIMCFLHYVALHYMLLLLALPYAGIFITSVSLCVFHFILYFESTASLLALPYMIFLEHDHSAYFTLYGIFRVWPLCILYLIWYVYDRKTPHQGGRRIQYFRHWKVWDYFRDFFPLTLKKTCDLDPSKNYLFALHPHGVLCVSHFCSFATEATGFSKLFPGITPHLIVLDGHFNFPLYREYFMTIGEFDFIFITLYNWHIAC